MFGEHPGQACSPRAPVDSRLEKWPAAGQPARRARRHRPLAHCSATCFPPERGRGPSPVQIRGPVWCSGVSHEPHRPGPCPVTGGWMLASAGASQSWAVCADGASCLVSCDCPSSRVRLFSSSGQIPGQRAPGSQVRARRTVGAEPALSHGDLGCRRTVQPWPSAWGPSL